MDNFHTISYARFCSRRIRQDERNLSLLGGSCLLNVAKGKNNEKYQAAKAAKATIGGFISYCGGHVELCLSPQAFPVPPLTGREPRYYRMSPRTRTKIREKSHAFIQAYGASTCTFLTLTFINKIYDKQAQKVLNKFLTVLRARFSDLSYLWVAERQNGKRNGYSHCTGNVHYHVLCNRVLPVSAVNGLWIRQQVREGIIHPAIAENICRPGFKIAQLTDAELQQFLNPVDIDRIQDESACAGYLVKYMAKSDDVFESQVWNCSRDVSAMCTRIALSKRQWENNHTRSSNTVVNRKGQLIEAKRTCIYDAQNRLVAVTSPVLNIRYFNRKYLKELASINKMIVNSLAQFREKKMTLDPYRVTTEYYLTSFNLTVYDE